MAKNDLICRANKKNLREDISRMSKNGHAARKKESKSALVYENKPEATPLGSNLRSTSLPRNNGFFPVLVYHQKAFAQQTALLQMLAPLVCMFIPVAVITASGYFGLSENVSMMYFSLLGLSLFPMVDAMLTVGLRRAVSPVHSGSFSQRG